MERRVRKAINFDLDTVRMREMSLYPVGYKKLKKSLKKHGFIHRQGSGYISKDKLDSDLINELVYSVLAEQPWLAECVKKIDVTDIGRQHDLTDIVREFAAEQAELARQVGQAEPARQAEQAEKKNTKEKLTAEDEAVIERIRSSRRGTEFETLWRGEPLTDDPKRDEFQLMNYLAFFTKCNKAQMQRIFQHSGLYHPERGQSYLDRCIDKAVTTLNMRLSDRAGQGRTNSRGNGGYKGK